MRCFYHGDVEAVALCKSCHHAICHDCCADVDRAAACRNRCEEDVAALNDIIARNRTVYQKTSATYFWMSLFFLALGVLIGIGGVMSLSSDEPNASGIVIGALFLLMGVVFLISARRFKSK